MSERTWDNMITSISYDQEEIIRNIITLYCPEGIECDPTYSKGLFYKNIQNPIYKFDLHPPCTQNKWYFDF